MLCVHFGFDIAIDELSYDHERVVWAHWTFTDSDSGEYFWFNIEHTFQFICQKFEEYGSYSESTTEDKMNSFRIMIQIWAAIYSNTIFIWNFNFCNWLEIGVLSASLITLFFFTNPKSNEDGSAETLLIVTTAFVCFKLINFLKSINASFFVFLCGLRQVFFIIIPFFIATGIVVGAFGLMLYIDSKGTIECNYDATDKVYLFDKFCTIEGFYSKAYAMLLHGNVFEENLTVHTNTI